MHNKSPLLKGDLFIGKIKLWYEVMLSIKLYSSILIFLLFTTNCFASAETDFKQGVKHYKNKQYKTAIKYFRLAHKQGLKTAALYHNLAVSHFKLSKFERAEHYFKITQRYPQ